MNVVFCVESSFVRGMGHLYRSLRLAQEFLRFDPTIQISFLLNNDVRSAQILKDNNINYFLVDSLLEKDWEINFLKGKIIDVWISDRLDTTLEHITLIKSSVKKVISFDDRGEGAKLVNINFAPLIFGEVLGGQLVKSGPKYLILEKNLQNYCRIRTSVKNILISLGGSDNYSLTLSLLKILDLEKYNVTVLLGPLNTQEDEVRLLYPKVEIKKNVADLGALFFEQDLLLSGGGMMPFEAMSTGLPVICCASETFEIPVCQFLEKQGAAFYLGFREKIEETSLNSVIKNLNAKIEQYSEAAISVTDFKASSRIYGEVFSER